MLNDNAEYARLIQGCESELLHLSGAIQPFGALVRIDPATKTISHASKNLAEFMKMSPADVLGRTVESLEWLPADSLEKLAAAEGSMLALINVAYDGSTRIDANLIRTGDGIVVEFEKALAAIDALAMFAYQHPLMLIPDTPQDLKNYHGKLLTAIQAISGFGRCMIYRFMEDWDGEVIAEVAQPSDGTYLGLRFPASDIPAIARTLYLKNASRMIPDVNAEPVQILGLQSEPPDLTFSDLRSVSPVHLEYLGNMGVAASFSVPIKVGGQLWGLLACHNGKAATLSPEQRAACVAITSAYSVGISSYTSTRRLQMLDSIDYKTDELVQLLSKYSDPLDGVERYSERLMQSLDANGFAFIVGNQVAIAGEGLDMEALGLLDDWFSNQCNQYLFSTHHISEEFADSNLIFAGTAGFTAIKVRSTRLGWLRLYWFRSAEEQEITWAGNPNKPITEMAGAPALSPRRSFERWVEVKHGFCRSWTNENRLVASKLRSALLRWLS
ncbi:GAF domain-containing protein [Rheinheimera baltica]|uniref:GAF domain-containing protein n=1 Tax=Rheinheimera baltica TaxID=67576 RepID=A0ABT9HX47_9GAMM|nr:GAF domain-containing protein [Rheinheimera baltica]MDP5135699.1 GAF domain-containing protein [Rheinheimera baltica]